MSGLFGYMGPASPAVEVAGRMGAAVRHAAGQYAAHPVVDVAPAGTRGALGRIGIGIFNRAAQPAVGAGGLVQLFLCGEFYHQQSRRSALVRAGLLAPDGDDAELALQVYLQEGAAGLACLEGAFVVAVWDERQALLTIVNDRFGLYPHYYARPPAGFCFAPEIKGVVAAPGVPRTLDLTAVAEHVRFQHLLGDRTWLEDVKLLPPATLLRYSLQDDTLALSTYWDFDAIRPEPRVTFDEAVEETIRRFQRAIDAMTQPPQRVGVYLSGGLDGRTILGFIDPATPVETFTFGARASRDVRYGTALARRAGRPHRWFSLDDGRWLLEHTDAHLALVEGMHSWMHAHGISTLAEARTRIDVHLSGWDGGTTMGGRLDEFEDDHALRHAPDEATLAARLYEAFCRKFIWPGLTDAEAAELFVSPEVAGRARASFEAELARTAHYPQPYRADYFYILQHCRRATQSMLVFQRSAFEVRCPFFDYGVMEWLYALPEEAHCVPQFHRAVITRRMPALARIPHEKDNLPPHSSPLVRGAGRGLRLAQRAVNKLAGPIFADSPRLYADYENYLRGDLRAWAEGILLDPRTLARDLFRPETVHRLWQRHQRGDELWTIGKVASLITVEQMIRALVEGEGFAARPAAVEEAQCAF